MSKYKIYRINHHDPHLVGKRRRRLNYLLILAIAIFSIIYFLLRQIFTISFLILYPAFILLLIGFYYPFHRKLKAENKSFDSIGDIEFTQAGIFKHIGDSTTEYKYDSIKSIELQKHIPALTPSDGKSGYYTHILSLDFKDSHKEMFVVSDRPLGKWRDLSIIETLKTLKRMIPAEIEVK